MSNFNCRIRNKEITALMYEVGGYPVGLFGFMECIALKIENMIRSGDGKVFKIYDGKKVINLNVNLVLLLGIIQ